MRVASGVIFDQPAQAVGGRRHRRIAEGRGFALDVVGGVEQRSLVALGEAVVCDGVARLVEPVAFGSIQAENSLDSSASAFSARATGSSSPGRAAASETALRSLFSGVITS